LNNASSKSSRLFWSLQGQIVTSNNKKSDNEGLKQSRIEASQMPIPTTTNTTNDYFPTFNPKGNFKIE